jgi:hypothetical protein
VVAGFNGG